MYITQGHTSKRPPHLIALFAFLTLPLLPPTLLNAGAAIRRPWILALRFMRYRRSIVVRLVFGRQRLRTPSTTNPMPEVGDEREVGEGEAACGCKGVGVSLVFTRSLHQN